MPGLEIKFFMQGKELSLGSLIETVLQQVRASVHDEISRIFAGQEVHRSDSPQKMPSDVPRQAVSIREAARLLSISPRTVDKYVALKVINTVRVGRRVLVPMKSVNQVAARGIPRPHYDKPVCTQTR